MSLKWRRVAHYSALGLAGLLVILVLVLTFVDWNRFRAPLGRIASAHFGREVTLAGPLQVHLWSSTPSLSIDDLQVGNPPWESTHRFVQIERLEVQLDLHSLFQGHVVLRRVALIHPELYLHREGSGRANWTFENTAPNDDRASEPIKLPAIQNALIDSGKLILVDDIRRLNVKGTIDAHESKAGADPRPLHVEGSGTLNSEPFKVDLSGGALLAISPDHPYAFTLKMEAGKHQIGVEGTVLKPFDLSGLKLQVSARGPDLAELYYLTQLALPNTPPYQVQADVVRTGQRFEIRDIKGLMGATDIGGSVDVDASHKRPFIAAKLSSRHVYLKDLGALTGSRVGADASLDAASGTSGSKTRAQRASPQLAKLDTDRLFPDAHLQVNRVQGMDAEVSFAANAVTAGTVPFTRVAFNLTLKDGILRVHPARLDMPQGRLSAEMAIDTHLKPPRVQLDVRAADVELEQVKGKSPSATPPLGGIFQARALIDGRGDSVRSLMADANGTATGVIPHGDIRAAFAELTGVDVAEGIGLLFKKPGDRATIRCGLVQFEIQDGTAHADSLLMDTQNVLITGTGQIELGSEKLDISIQGKPKKFRLVRIKAPIEIKGHLLKPTFALEGGHLVKQGAIAATLGAVITPLAAILAFVDPGLAKDQNCANLNPARSASNTTPSPSRDAAQRLASTPVAP